MRTASSLMRTALLALAYYLVVTPVGLVSRILHDPLRRGLDRRASTYMIYLAGADRSGATEAGPGGRASR